MSSTATKRKSTAGAGVASKKARTDNSHEAARALVSEILANPDAYAIPERDEDVRKILIELAEYARALEGQNASGSAGAPPKSKEQLEEAAEKIRRAAHAGIKKQMSWKPSCKTGGAKWSYDGICPDPNVFGVLMGLDGPPTWKMKKFTVNEFDELMGEITSSARYSELRLTGTNVNARWSDTGEFKFSGTYGV
ncbi:unnamed protein product [Somion occarium]|uniref:Uncharacterized protein n=1 Tax=Somion occarium TaxID=3059160 RepID=A0ABP1CZ69_9APHY